MMQLLTILCIIIIGVFCVTCPPNYQTYDTNSCHSETFFASSRNEAYDVCAKDGAYLYDVVNGFSNNWVQQQGKGAQSIWLGLTCAGSYQFNCIWDTGVQMKSSDWSNFPIKKTPNSTLGACIYMDVATGIWHNGDCSRYKAAYGCKYTPNIIVPLCTPVLNYPTVTIRENCVFAIPPQNWSSANETCVNNCGNIFSVHNEGPNSFLQNFGASIYPNVTYQFTGIWSEIFWSDGSWMDYTNYGYNNKQLGSCVAMALKDDLVPAGKWINTDCNNPMPTICVRNLETMCTGLTTTPPTLSPSMCSTPIFLSGNGTVYSSAYPASAPPENCEYLVTVDHQYNAQIIFTELVLDYQSSISFYASITDTVPFKTIYSNTSDIPINVTAPTNTMKMIFTTRGEGSRWAAMYQPLMYNCSQNAYYSGIVTSPNYPDSYPQLTMNCIYTLDSMPNHTITCVKFDFVQLRSYDQLIIYDGVNTPSNYGNNTFCTRFKRQITVQFKTYWTSSGNGTGWIARFAGSIAELQNVTTVIPTTPNPTCGNAYFYNGTITSPNYPNPYPAEVQNCTYNLNAMQTVTCLVFDKLKLRTGDSVELYDGKTSNILITRFISGDTAPGVYCTRHFPDMLVLLSTINPNFTNDAYFQARFAAGPQYLPPFE